MTDHGDSASAADRARAGLEAFIIGLTPSPGSGPLVDQFVAEHPEAGIVRSINDIVEADADARQQGEHVPDQVEKTESADESDPPDGFLGGLRDLNIEWNSPYVDTGDTGDTEPDESESNESGESE